MDVEATKSTAEAFLADQGSSAFSGMLGAAILWVVMPPVNKKGKFSRLEFVLRLGVAAIFSMKFGGMVASALQNIVPWLDPLHNRSAIDLMTGAPAWWISRAIALWFHRRNDKDISEIIKEVKQTNSSNDPL